jgi:hypothetical protein
MNNLSIHDRDTLNFDVIVRDEATRTFPLTGATVQSYAGQNGVGSVVGACSVPQPANGRIEVSFPAAALGVGAWTVEVIVTLGGETQTVSTMIVTVRQSLSAP